MEALSKKLEATQKEAADLERAIASGQQRLLFLRGMLQAYRDVADAVAAEEDKPAETPAADKVIPISAAQ